MSSGPALVQRVVQPLARDAAPPARSEGVDGDARSGNRREGVALSAGNVLSRWVRWRSVRPSQVWVSSMSPGSAPCFVEADLAQRRSRLLRRVEQVVQGGSHLGRRRGDVVVLPDMMASAATDNLEAQAGRTSSSGARRYQRTIESWASATLPTPTMAFSVPIAVLRLVAPLIPDSITPVLSAVVVRPEVGVPDRRHLAAGS